MTSNFFSLYSSQKGWKSNDFFHLEKSCVEVYLLEHAEQVSQSGTEGIEAAEDVLLAEAELADVLPYLPVLYPGIGVFVTLWTFFIYVLVLRRSVSYFV
jgi:hypothetical protein